MALIRLVRPGQRDFRFWAVGKGMSLAQTVKGLDESNAPFFRVSRWELNASINCLTAPEIGQKTAISSNANGTGTKSPTAAYTGVQFANAYRSASNRRAVIYMPMSIEVVIAMQACARIAATHSVCRRLPRKACRSASSTGSVRDHREARCAGGKEIRSARE